jgi:hypothetical protein
MKDNKKNIEELNNLLELESYGISLQNIDENYIAEIYNFLESILTNANSLQSLNNIDDDEKLQKIVDDIRQSDDN